MDDVAQTAVEARIQAANAHARLDGINGQIRRAGDEIANVRVDMATQFGEVKTELAKVKTRVGVYAGVGAFLATAIMGPLAVAIALHFMPPPKAAQATVDKTPTIIVQTPTRHNHSVPASNTSAGQPRAHTASHAGHPTSGSHNETPTSGGGSTGGSTQQQPVRSLVQDVADVLTQAVEPVLRPTLP